MRARGTTSSTQRAFNQANNEPLHPNPHPLAGTAWHVACEGIWLTKVLLTTEHTKLHVGQLVIWKTLLGLQSWSREEEEGSGGGFLRSNEL